MTRTELPLALTRRELDQAQCSVPGCDHTSHDDGLFLSAVCHPGTAVRAHYRAGVIAIACATCGAFIANIAVADGWQ